ncbi:6-phosphogluconolactonase [Paenibacillus sp. UNCCL117]|uniref:lactonase family protein n=1 Tax=unclassified Paenibacillus TaxID=185978 RepID=UPI0008853421|nr:MULTISPECIES: lactonase family protein [unclassified Paenibacillus]SDD90060.1 6-phosphogluconolactonase [Paenibacillus sp. cl123]SFW44008.1 6-phosphogluconolactonase [Paenibacillus sp. UNCCL117]
MPMERSKELPVYVGTYQEKGANSIFRLQLNTETGALERISANAQTDNPSFLIRNEAGDRLYGVVEHVDESGVLGGSVTAFAVDRDSGELSLLGTRTAHGGATCHLALAGGGRALIAANYMNGSVAVFPVLEDGSLGEASDVQQHEGSSMTDRQQGPHAHCVALKGDFVYVTDLGTDEIVRYRFDASGPRLKRLGAVKVAAGQGPRHLTFHETEPFAYLINELGNTIIAYRYEAEAGELTAIETVPTLPKDYAGTSYCADIHIHPSGKVLYGSNRGHNSIVVFAIDRATGRLTLLQHEPTQGDFPRNFGLTPDGAYLVAANQNSDSLVTYKVDPEQGTLTPTGFSLTIPRPACVLFSK